MRRVGVAVLALLAAACGEPEAAPSAQTGRGPGGTSASAAPIGLPALPGTAPSAQAPSTPRMRPPRLPPLPSTGAAGGQPEGERIEEAAGPSQAELSDALARAFGTPTACIGEATRARLDEHLTLQVQVVATAEGRVTRASVSGAGLSDDDLECMRRRAEALRLALRVPDAPRSITTSIAYEVRAGRVQAANDAPPPVALAPGRLAPDTTLPAAGAETARPTGFVAPSQTLPAQVEPSGTLPGRPPGFVPPSQTLPAQAE